MGTDNVFGFWKNVHMVRDFPKGKNQGKDVNLIKPSGFSSDAPEKDPFYALNSRIDKKDPSDFVTFMLQVFSINV